MALIDRRIAPKVEEALIAALVALRNRCPDCTPLDVPELAVAVLTRVTVDLDEPLYEQLRKAAFDRHESVSAALREALKAWLPEDKDSGG